MLSWWKIKDFKSFAGETLINLSAINVFAGANSSGKSTILQSVLLIKQTLQSTGYGRPLVLNGPIFKLGTMTDVTNSARAEPGISLGWEFHADNAVYYRRGYAATLGYATSGLARTRLETITCDFTWDAARPEDQVQRLDPMFDSGFTLQPRLYSADLHVRRREREGKQTNSTDVTLIRREKLQLGIEYYPSHLDEVSTREVLGNRPGAEIIGATTAQFWPSFFFVRYDASRYRATRTAEALCTPTSLLASAPFILEDDLPASVIEVVLEWLREQGASDEEQYPFIQLAGEAIDSEELARRIHHLRSASRSGLLPLSAEPSRGRLDFAALQQRIEAALLAESSGEYELEPENVRTLSEAGDVTRTFFREFVRYLGPLRDEPKSVYPREALVDPTDVGTRGELTAAVLDLNSARNVRYIPPDAIDTLNFRGNGKNDTLHNAVVDWLNYVGVATEVAARDFGKYGHQLQVQAERGGRYHDLTHVGVGVSQVLPIIVMSLLAPAGSLLIFEQPELHLHPKVQARLGDFFISMGLLNKQCLLETHSEYLIERFRLRIAQSNGDQIRRLFSLYFTERSEGATSCKPVEVNEFGAILNWPKDFFDQSQREAEQIIRAASSKRRKSSAPRQSPID